jgi:hypothetical protein
LVKEYNFYRWDMHKLKEAKLIMLPMTTHTGCCNLHLDNKRY